MANLNLYRILTMPEEQKSIVLLLGAKYTFADFENNGTLNLYGPDGKTAQIRLNGEYTIYDAVGNLIKHRKAPEGHQTDE